MENLSFTLFQCEEALGVENLDIHRILGKPIALNFWAKQCPHRRAEMPDPQEFYESYKDEVNLLGIDVGQFTGSGNRRIAAGLLKEINITYPAGYTGDGSVASKYKVVSMPTTVFINPDGTIFRTWSGILNVDILNRLTSAMINQAAKEQVLS